MTSGNRALPRVIAQWVNNKDERAWRAVLVATEDRKGSWVKLERAGNDALGGSRWSNAPNSSEQVTMALISLCVTLDIDPDET